MVDCEHGNIDDSDMFTSVGALASAGTSPIVRTVGSDGLMIKRAIDCGAHAVMVPMCESAVSFVYLISCLASIALCGLLDLNDLLVKPYFPNQESMGFMCGAICLQ